MTVSNAEALSEVRQAQADNAAAIVAKFVAGTFAAEFTSAVGRKYVVRGVPSRGLRRVRRLADRVVSLPEH